MRFTVRSWFGIGALLKYSKVFCFSEVSVLFSLAMVPHSLVPVVVLIPCSLVPSLLSGGLQGRTRSAREMFADTAPCFAASSSNVSFGDSIQQSAGLHREPWAS